MEKILVFTFLLSSLGFLLAGAHPVLISIMLAASALAISLFAFSLASSWFFYLLVLVFLGGVMVLIMYMSTLCTNEKFSVSSNSFLVLMIFAFGLPLISISEEVSGSVMSNLGVGMLYESEQIFSMIFLMSYLLLALVCVVKLVKFESGPLVKRL